jgi:hypothetical protein
MPASRSTSAMSCASYEPPCSMSRRALDARLSRDLASATERVEEREDRGTLRQPRSLPSHLRRRYAPGIFSVTRRVSSPKS